MRFKIISSNHSRKLAIKIFLPLILSLCVGLTFLFSTLSVLAAPKKLPKNKSADPIVIIDAGHGGFDGGATVGEIYEKDINLSIANTLSDMLKLSGVTVINTRTTDSSTESDPTLTISARKKSDIKNRLALANSQDDAIFVSIHLNKFDSPSAKGAQIFYAPNAKNSDILAEEIRKSIINSLQKENKRPLKKSTKDAYILYHSQIPAVIVECGFMSNQTDLKNLLDKEYQTKLAFAICTGILEYLDR